MNTHDAGVIAAVFTMGLGLGFWQAPAPAANQVTEFASPDREEHRISTPCPDLSAHISALRDAEVERDKYAARLAMLQGQTEAQIGAYEPFPADLDPMFTEVAVEEALLSIEAGNGVVSSLDCSEYPCIAQVFFASDDVFADHDAWTEQYEQLGVSGSSIRQSFFMDGDDASTALYGVQIAFYAPGDEPVHDRMQFRLREAASISRDEQLELAEDRFDELEDELTDEP